MPMPQVAYPEFGFGGGSSPKILPKFFYHRIESTFNLKFNNLGKNDVYSPYFPVFGEGLEPGTSAFLEFGGA